VNSCTMVVVNSVELVVEAALELHGRSYVIARALGEHASVHVTSRSTLGGAALEPWLDIPRAISDLGVPRQDLIGFCLRSAQELARFEPGQRVLFVADAEAV
jgi:hypothetical protein